MADRPRDEHDQPMPIPNAAPSIQSRVRADLEAREQVGIRRYGTPLQPFNGRKALLDLYEELLDATCYIKQHLVEQGLEREPVKPDTEATEHEPMQIGTHHADGSRTHAPPGDVCASCSDPEAGRWVPVSQCPEALAEWERQRAERDVLEMAALESAAPATPTEPQQVRFQLKHSDQCPVWSDDRTEWLTGVVLQRYDGRTIIRAGNYRFAHTVLDEHVHAATEVLRVWKAGDPQPDDVWKVRDRHGDVWTRRVNDMWDSPDTKPCGWPYIAKKWAPLTEVVETAPSGIPSPINTSSDSLSTGQSEDSRRAP